MKIVSLFLILGLMSVCPWCAYAQAVKTPAAPPADGVLQYVNPLQGTDSGFGTSINTQSYGNCLPLIGAPWGMLDWSIQTQGGASRGSCGQVFFQYNQKRILGLRVTRMPSPFTGDYGTCLITPQSGPLVADTAEIGSSFDLNACCLRPDYMRVEMKDSKIVAELTASERCGVMRFNFGDAKEGRLFIDPGGAFTLDTTGRMVKGSTKLVNGKADKKFTTYFVGVLDRDITRSGGHTGGKNPAKIGGYVEFDISTRPLVEFTFAQSYISLEQAELNLKTETQGGFEAVQARTASLWTKYLNRISIEGSDEQKKTFYTCLYRTMKFPHRLHEVNAEGKTVHFSPFDGKVHDGVGYTDSGLWDTYRTQFPLLSIICPEQLGDIVQGWVNAFQEAGRLPQWPNPGGISGMVGTHADSMIADAIVKGVKGFDVNKAYEAIRTDAFGTKVRPGQEKYLSLGYVPFKGSEYWVSTTLDYAYDDWCVAQVAKLLGKDDDYKQLMARAQNYRKLWDPAVGFMRGKKDDGSWVEPFDEFAWGAAYTEGGPWQASWAVQHDVFGLASLLGGKENLAAKLDKLVNQAPTFHAGGYGRPIHEMTEMATFKMGQLALCNQPAFHFPYMYASAGQPWKCEALTRKVCDDKINSGPRGYPGDEDNGSASSWYVLSALGFYPMTPGHPSYVLTSPVFAKATINLSGGKTFVISAPGNNQKNVYVQMRLINGKEDTKTWISHQTITTGGTLSVELGDKPHERPVKDDELPYSASAEK
jgi:predicted alpha-1,2-mannosidase